MRAKPLPNLRVLLRVLSRSLPRALAIATACFSFALAFLLLRTPGQPVPSLVSSEEVTQWVSAPPAPRGVVMAVPGLNFRPSRLGQLASLLSENGFAVLRVGLSGHHGDSEAFRDVTRERWLDDVRQAYRQARAQADELHVPLLFLGYSLGGLLVEDLATSTVPPDLPPVRFDAAILIAPALALRPYTRLILWLRKFPFLSDRFIVPGFSESLYQAAPGVSLAGYRSVFELLREFQVRAERSQVGHANVPTLVLIDPKDELIDPDGIARLIVAGNLSRWLISPVHIEINSIRRNYHHLFIDEPAAGKAEWRRLGEVIAAFLRAHS